MNTFNIKRFSILLFVISFLTTFNIIWTREEQTKQQVKHVEVEKNASKRYSYKSTGDPKTVTLKHIYHRCTSKYPNLIRRKDISEASLRVHELKTGVSFTYTLKGINGTKMTPTKYPIDEYRQKSKNEQISLKMDWETTEGMLPDVKDWDTLINLAKITYNAYTLEENEDWYDLGDDYHRRDSFGWEGDGIRGHVFGDEKNETIIIAFKGTSMGFNADEYPNATIWLTGHSLGGALSSLLGITFGLPAVGFESPGERLAAERLHLPKPPAIPYDKMNIWHIGHSADPIFMGGMSSSCYIGGYAVRYLK
ncbi:11562_t:CDS:2 [Diversispora eburnea]|uniref:triacylglycerol lipase n=1 Tax=Diversispora eburnea TaxID=1213867 RepID=A0A9N9AEP3_9GLOM|nr:11562_t:CDS:2 [Diversispora eburnea]